MFTHARHRFVVLSLSFLLSALFACSPERDVVQPPGGDITAPAFVQNLVSRAATEISIELAWTAPGDDGVTGQAAQYDVRYSTTMITAQSFGAATRVTGVPAPKAAGQSEVFVVGGLQAGTTYWFALKTADEGGNWSSLSNLATLATAPAGQQPVVGTIIGLPGGVGTGDVKVYAGADSFLVGTDGKCNLQVTGKTNQVVMLGDAQGKLIHLTIFPPDPADPGKQLELSAEETAASLVLLNPFLSTNKAAVLAQARADLLTRTKFNDLKTLLGTKIQGGYRLGDDDPQIKQALGDLYGELFADLGHRFRALGSDKADPPAVNGLAIETVSIDASVWRFRVRNSLQRWIAAYGQPMHNDGTGGTLSPLLLLSSPPASILDVVLGGETPATVVSAVLELPAQGYDYAQIELDGIGSGAGMTDEQMNRAYDPIVRGAVFDFGLPMISALSGVPVADLAATGDLSTHPLTVFAGVVQQQCPQLRDDLLAAMRSQDTPGAFAVLTGCFLETLTERPGDWVTAVNGVLALEPGVTAPPRRVLLGWIGPMIAIARSLQDADLTWAYLGELGADAVTRLRYDYPTATGFPVRLEGRVINAAGSAGIGGAVVTVIGATGLPVAVAVSGDDGRFAVQVPAGALTVTVTSTGFFTAVQPVVVPSDITVYTLTTTLLASYADTTGGVSGKVINATNGQGMAGARVILVRGLDPAGTDRADTTETSAEGVYSFEGIAPGSFTVVASAEGFLEGWVSLAVVGGVVSANHDIVLTTPLGEGYRFVLSWGELPRDLDSHLATPAIGGTTYQILYNERGSLEGPPYALLDVDDTDSYGPETVTIGQSFEGVYRYAVYQYSSEGDIRISNARVILYNGNTVVRQWSVPTVGDGRWWYVCDLNAVSGGVVEKNALQIDAPEGMTVSKEGKPAK